MQISSQIRIPSPRDLDRARARAREQAESYAAKKAYAIAINQGPLAVVLATCVRRRMIIQFFLDAQDLIG